jgi:hypoxia-inducible factor 1-alpha inhibitor (HIF hydroxylase)
VSDFKKFDWNLASALPMALGWGGLTNNMLFVGMPGVVTPAHFDEQENLFAQLKGRKHVSTQHGTTLLLFFFFAVS